MPTRQKKPSIIKQLAVTFVLLGFLTYLGYSAISGQYGILGRRELQAEIANLNVESAKLQAEIDAYKHRISLFDPERLDPDILSEKARALLNMAQAGDRIVLLPAEDSKL